MTESEYRLEKRVVRRSFDRASTSYDTAARLQGQVRELLLGRLDWLGFAPETIVDLGCGTGHGARALRDRWRKARVVAMDIAPGMLRVAGQQQGWFRRFDRVCADALALPLASASVDLLFSNLMLQWCDDLDAVFREFRRVLRPRGVLCFTTFGPATLHELRSAWAEADDYTHVSPFADMHQIGEGLMRAGLAEPVLDIERMSLQYADMAGLMRDLKAIGAGNATIGRARGLTTRARLVAATNAYEAYRSDGLLPASYEVIFGQAWAPGATAPQRSQRRGEFTVAPDSIGRRSG